MLPFLVAPRLDLREGVQGDCIKKLGAIFLSKSAQRRLFSPGYPLAGGGGPTIARGFSPWNQIRAQPGRWERCCRVRGTVPARTAGSEARALRSA